MSLLVPDPPREIDSHSRSRELESLAKRYFALLNSRALEELREVLHPDVALEMNTVGPTTVLKGREEVIRFLGETFPHRLWEAVVQACETLGDNRAVVAGRVRWMDDQRVLRDDPHLWALEFCDGLLLRSVPVRSVREAESILTSAESDADPSDAYPTSSRPAKP
jgi:ketosteroid isomerase-like protein